MSERESDLAVVVVNWNGGASLCECLGSAFAATDGMRVEVWLVDNASSDGSADRASEQRPGLRLVRNRDNLGFARAANQALSQTSTAFVLLLNPDAELNREALVRMLDVMGGDPRVGIAGCPSTDAHGRRVPGHEVSFPGRREVGVAQADGCGQDVAWVSGACLLARRGMIEDIGLLDDGYFMYYEDVDWCWRARQSGWRVVTVPDAMVRHGLGGSSAHVPRAETARRAAASRLRFCWKHYPPMRARSLWLRALLASLWGIAWRLAPSAVSRSAREGMASQCARLSAALAARNRGRGSKR